VLDEAVKSFDDFSPTIAFYGDKPMVMFREVETKEFERPFQMITRREDLGNENKYVVTEEIDGYVVALFE